MLKYDKERISHQKEEIEDAVDEWFDENHEEAVSIPVKEWMDEHPEATTTVQDHSLTIDKMVLGTLGYVTPQMFGAVGDGIADDTESFLAALENGKPIIVPAGTYLVSNLGTITHKEIYGEHRDTTIINYTGTLVLEDNCILENLSFVKPAYPESMDDPYLMNIRAGMNILNNVYIRNYANGILLSNDQAGCCFNKLNNVFIVNSFQHLKLLNEGTGWVNENTFINVQCRMEGGFKAHCQAYEGYTDLFAVIIDSTEGASFHSNGNVFLQCSTEDCFNGIFCKGNTNTFIGHRFEGNVVAFDNPYTPFSRNNIVIGGYEAFSKERFRCLNENGEYVYSTQFLKQEAPLFVQELRIHDGNGNVQKSGIFYNNRAYEFWFRDKHVFSADASGKVNFLHQDVKDFVCHLSNTANRPTDAVTGQMIYDYTLKLPLWFDGTNWKDASGAVR